MNIVRLRQFFLLVLSLGLVGTFGYMVYSQFSDDDPQTPTSFYSPVPPDQNLCRVPVPTNRGPNVENGFHGDLHPLLHGHSQTEVRAYWIAPKSDSLDLMARFVPLESLKLYRDARPSVPTKSYTEREFSGLLPEKIASAGQLWAIDPERFIGFLSQFHPAVSVHSTSIGRRPGPDGAFGILRGVSPTHLDIVFRVHGEFDLLPKPSLLPVVNAWYSPAYFQGRLVVNRDSGTIAYFQLGVPSEKTTNAHVTISSTETHSHTTHRVDRMELIGGSLTCLNGVNWTDQIDVAQASDRLAANFYKFKEIRFVPFEGALASAKMQGKPLLAVVLLGGLDDQSC